jgi:RHS repeat-associated protein
MHPSAVTYNPLTGKNYTYDANGNMLTRGNQTLTWDVDNRVSQISISGGGTTYMEYAYTGIRIKKNAPSGISLYPFQGYEIDPNGVVTKFIRIGVETFASKRGTNKYFYHSDYLGSVNVITDINGTRVQLNEYDPWGGVSRTEGSIDPTHRFNGKELDPESGLYYYGGRYYDPEISRFVSADPFVQAPGNPQSLNRYSYVWNNPQRYTDPSGYEGEGGGGGCWWCWRGIFSLFGHHKKHPHPAPPPAKRFPSYLNQPGVVNTRGQTPENVLVYSSNDTGGNDSPSDSDWDWANIVLSLTVNADLEKPENNDQVTRKIACTVDTLITFGLSVTIPGAAAVKTGLGLFDVTFNPVQSLLGYKPVLSAGPTIPSILAGISSGYWIYGQAVFSAAGGQARLDRLQDLASRTFSGAENAKKYGSKINELERLSKAVSVERNVTTVLSGFSAAYDAYVCWQAK